MRIVLWIFMMLTCSSGEFTHESLAHLYEPYFIGKYTGDSANVSKLLDSLLDGYDRRLRPNYKGKILRLFTWTPLETADEDTYDKATRKEGLSLSMLGHLLLTTRGPPVEVGVTMYVSSVSSISEVDMDFTVDFYFRQHWHDPRLAYQHLDADLEELCISTDMLARLWWPDTFFANAKEEKFHIATTKNAFLRIKPNGDIMNSLRLTVTAMCKMDLTFFPMDSQICSLEIESYGYSVRDINYFWKSGKGKSTQVSKEVQLPQFRVLGHREVERLEVLSTGNYSRLACEFYFVRSMGYYLIQIYVPSLLIVVLSWVSFWLSREAVPARVALGITTVLTMTTLISSTNASLPRISYLKSIDVYLVTCFGMVFASLLEFAAVSYIGNRYKRRMAQKKEQRPKPPRLPGESIFTNGALKARKASSPCSLPEASHAQTEVRLLSMRKLHTECDLRTLTSNTVSNNYNHHQVERPASTVIEDNINVCFCDNFYCCTKPSVIDRYSRLLFPLVFMCFNVMYWTIYLNISDTDTNPHNSGFIFLNQ